jgi:hypothetical protein
LNEADQKDQEIADLKDVVVDLTRKLDAAERTEDQPETGTETQRTELSAKRKRGTSPASIRVDIFRRSISPYPSRSTSPIEPFRTTPAHPVVPPLFDYVPATIPLSPNRPPTKIAKTRPVNMSFEPETTVHKSLKIGKTTKKVMATLPRFDAWDTDRVGGWESQKILKNSSVIYSIPLLIKADMTCDWRPGELWWRDGIISKYACRESANLRELKCLLCHKNRSKCELIRNGLGCWGCLARGELCRISTKDKIITLPY